VDDTNEHNEVPLSPGKGRRSINSKAIPYGTEEMGTFVSDEWENSWEINHTITSPR
jgi:hypothetical protein